MPTSDLRRRPKQQLQTHGKTTSRDDAVGSWQHAGPDRWPRGWRTGQRLRQVEPEVGTTTLQRSRRRPNENNRSMECLRAMRHALARSQCLARCDVDVSVEVECGCRIVRGVSKQGEESELRLGMCDLDLARGGLIMVGLPAGSMSCEHNEFFDCDPYLPY